MSSTTTGKSGGRPMIMGTREVVSSGHYLATQIGMDILAQGGNAMDAAAAVGLALTVLKPHQNGIAGEVPMLFHSAREDRVWAISGQGVAPREATLEHFARYNLEVIPGDGLLPAVVPSTVATWITLLERFGTLRLSEVLEPAVELARRGFPMYDHLRDTIRSQAERFKRDWPSSAKNWLIDGNAPESGSVFRQPEWADAMSELVRADRSKHDRLDGLRAAHEVFYSGSIARRIVEFCRNTLVPDATGKAHTGLLSFEDLAGFSASFEDSVSTDYRGLLVHKCSSWTQGPAMLEALNLLENFDLRSMGHNSARYIHVVTECMKLAYADREFYYGDPLMVEVPLEQLLSKDYARRRAELIDGLPASMELRPGLGGCLRAESITDVDQAFVDAAGGCEGDTTKLAVIDSAGNAVSAMSSGGWLMSSPVIPGLGFPLGTRGQMFSLVAGHPNCLAPMKRPRTTLTPSLATRDGKPVMAFGSPGGDRQDQWALQFLLNVVEFDMSLQAAVEAPTFWTLHAPRSFYPRNAEPGVLHLEGRIGQAVRDELAARGHIIRLEGDWAGGNTLAVAINPESGVRLAAASPRLEPAYAAGR